MKGAFFLDQNMASEAYKLEEHYVKQSYDYIVVGTGPVGVRFIQEVLKLNNNSNSIAVFGDEPWKPYNRIKLSSLVSGDVKEDSLYASYDLSNYQNVTTFYNNRIVAIDRNKKEVIDSEGIRHCYDKLILATGSRAYIPAINGVFLKNVFTFRDLNDAQSLMGRSVRTRKTVIIGGGLLGLEAARAMQRYHTEVHIIEHSSWLMFNQLDTRAGSYLKRYVESLGVHVHVNERVENIIGDECVESVELSNGEKIDCDTVIIAAGIVSNNVLAVDSGIATGKGIRVNDFLQTSDEDIFAIGECIEHNNKMYGLVAPGFEHAAVLAHHLQGKKSRYTGSTSSTNLKVLDYPVFSVGETGMSARSREQFIYQDHKNEVYRKIVVINGKIRGAIGIGEWPGVHRFQEAVEHQRRVWPWQIKRFLNEGMLWNDAQSENVIDWPATATVCNCTGVTRGQLDAAMKRGACTVAELAQSTGASTVCGTCKPLVADFVGGNEKPTPVIGFKTLLGASIISVIAAFIIFFLPSLQYGVSAAQEINFDFLWRNSLFKQISGFTLLGLSIVISVVSLRKHFNKLIKLWDFAYWRVAHVVIGALLIVMLLAHTGFRLGSNLNFYLMSVFTALILVGSIAGLAIGYEHNLPRRVVKHMRSYAIWSHIILLWPLPVLLGFHILKTYYF